VWYNFYNNISGANNSKQKIQRLKNMLILNTTIIKWSVHKKEICNSSNNVISQLSTDQNEKNQTK
jgi:hypothetical protein